MATRVTICGAPSIGALAAKRGPPPARATLAALQRESFAVHAMIDKLEDAPKARAAAAPAGGAHRASHVAAVPLATSRSSWFSLLSSWLPFVAAVAVPLVTLAVMGVVSFRQSEREAELRSQRTAQVLAEHSLRTFRAHDLIIRAVDGHMAGWDWNTISTSRELHEFFQRLRSGADDINTIFVVGPTGREGNSSLVFPLTADMGGRPFYEELRRKRGLHVSDPDVGRINKQRYFSFTRRRSAGDDAFDGVISISVNPAYFESFYKAIAEDPTDSVSLVRADGLMLVRVPELAPSRRMASGLMARVSDQPQAGTFSARGAVDGVERIYSYQRVGDYPLYAAYGLSYATVWATWRRNMLAYATVCLSAIALLIAAAALVLRHTRREREAADRYVQETARRMAAEETNRAKDEFLATLGHELRNPLAAISASAEILRRGPSGDAGGAAVGIIARQVEHLHRLLNDLLDVARTIYGKMTLDRQVVSLADVAASVATTYPGAIRQEVSIEVGGARGWTLADPTRLRQIVTNLVDNAQKYGASHVAIEVRELDGWVELSVADDGGGIAQELLPSLFEPFVQGKQPLDRSTGGLGLGLALCQRLAVAHGGTLGVRSEGAGRGSTFTLRLPAAAPPDVDTPKAVERLPIARTRVLVVEDQADARDSLRLLLELDGYLVEVASSGREGIVKFETFHPDALLVDIGLPRMNGYEFAREIRSREAGKAVRLIAISGYGQPDDRQRAFEAGFDFHATKPVDYDELTRGLVRSAPAQGPEEQPRQG